jgi:nucleoside-diphosphate-sugar epimerase
MLQGNNFVKLGDPEPIRDLMYVEDHVNAYLTCLDNEKAIGETFNFCTGHGIKIADLVRRIREITGFDGEVMWNSIPKRPLDIEVLVGDNSKAKQLLNWQPRVGLEKGLRLTTEFLKDVLDKSRMKILPAIQL